MEYCTTIGADVSDRTTKICVMTKAEGGERRIARVDMFTSLCTMQGTTCKQPHSRPFTSLLAKSKINPSPILL